MNAIEQHIKYLFQDLPETDEIKRIKNDLHLNAMDRFDELIANGKAESEALGTIIIEMGDRDDLLQGFGYNQDQDLRDYSTNTLTEAKYIIEAYRDESNKIALGILMILVGAGLIPTLDTFNLVSIGIVLLLVFVALAVGLFIYGGMRLESVEESLHDEDKEFYLTDEDYRIVEDQYRDFKESNRFRIPLGVMLSIASAVPIILFGFYGSDFLIERYGVLLLVTLVGLGVYQFVKYGMVDTAYQKVLNLGEYSIEELQFQKKMEPAAGIYWMVVTAGYLGWSFITMDWGYTWIVWPIAGITWGIISMVLKVMSKQDRK